MLLLFPEILLTLACLRVGWAVCVCVCVCVVVGSYTVHESMNQEKDGLYLQHLSCWGYG